MIGKKAINSQTHKKKTQRKETDKEIGLKMNNRKKNLIQIPPVRVKWFDSQVNEVCTGYKAAVTWEQLPQLRWQNMVMMVNNVFLPTLSPDFPQS